MNNGNASAMNRAEQKRILAVNYACADLKHEYLQKHLPATSCNGWRISGVLDVSQLWLTFTFA